MAFANRFHFRFDSVHGVEYNIYILQDGYSGSCDDRKLGRAPVLRKQKNGPVCGTSLDLYAECAPGHDGEFAELFTSNPKEYRVDVWRKVSGTDVLIWQGFVSTELYSEPSIYPPYDVQIVATDGLGELKLVDFIPAGAVTLSEHFRTALAYTGMNRTIYVASSLIMTGESVTDTFSMSINLDYMDGDSYYDMVTKLLDTLHATITLYGDKWLIARETDLPALLSSSGLSVVSISTTGTVSTTTIGDVHKTVGSMADNSVDTWPVGQLSTVIDPARKEVTVEAPWHTISGPDDPNMEATTNSPWDTEGIVRHDTTDDCFYELGLDPEHQMSDDTWGTIKQEIPINKLDCGFELKLRVAPRVYKLRVGDPQWYAHGNIKVHLEYDCYISSSHGSERTSTYIGTEEGWSGAPQHASDPKVEIPVTELDSIGERWLSITIPAISTPESASRYIVSDYATVRIVIEGHWVEVYECVLMLSLDLPGYRDIIHMDNDAVGAADTVEITGGRVRSDNLVNSKFYGGIWIFGGNIVTSFADSVHSNGDFLSITTLSYALSVAGRRLKTDGKLNIPAGFSVIPLFITFGEILSWIETWEWDLVQEEAQILAISLPAVEVDVESETVEGLPEGSGGSGGSGNGSSASSSYSYKTGGSSFFEEDGNGNIKLKDEYGGLWTKGFLDAGGVGTGGGGGGGDVDMVEVWASLQNTATDTTRNDWKLSTAHLPTLGAGLAYTDNADSGESLATTLSIASTHYLPTAEEWAGVASNLEGLQAMQAQLDALATRDNFDELTATAFFADVAAISELYAGAINLNGQDVGTLLSHGETAYGWGDHAQAGYFAASSFTAANIVSTLGTTAVNRATADASGNDIANTYATATALGAVSGRVTTLESRQNWDEIFGLDSDGNVYIKKQTVGGVEVARGFWNYGFVDSGGAGSGSGGGGADITEVWASLQNTATDTSRNAWKFSTAHLPTLGAGLTYTDNADSGAGLATSLGIASTHYLPTAQEWAGVASNLEGLQAMQAQMDALASRDNFDELTATAFFAEVAAVSELYAYSIELNGADLATTLSGKQATISDLSTIRSRADEGHTAYGWGNHANAGYFAASSFTAANIVSTLGTTAVNRATADAAGENIADNFSTVSKALQSLQAQLNSVATRSVLDELSVANLFTDTLAASKIFAEAIDFGGYVLGASGSVMQWNGSALFSAMSSSAGTNLSITVGGQNRTATLYATYDSASENISDKFGIVSTALQSLQKQIDSVAAAVGNSDEIYAGCASFDTLAVGSGIYAGSLLATGYVNSGASASSSDARLKSNIEEISTEKAVSLLMELRGVEWDWNEKKACLEGRHGSGLVAQEVEKVMPWMVLDLNGELSLTYSSLWGVAIPVMQSHEERIAALERENAELKKRLNTITH